MEGTQALEVSQSREAMEVIESVNIAKIRYVDYKIDGMPVIQFFKILEATWVTEVTIEAHPNIESMQVMG